MERSRLLWETVPDRPGGHADDLARELGVPRAIGRILAARFPETDGLRDYLDPKLKDLDPPEDLPHAMDAARRLDRAIRDSERIVLFGDYDVDGVTSVALLARALTSLGGQVKTFLPHRVDEGYGLSSEGVERCCADCDPQLLVAVDCGTTAHEQIRTLRADGIDVIVLDHHEPGDRPAGALIVNPKCAGEKYRYLCSAGVVFKVLHCLLKEKRVRRPDLREYLDLVAIATVADIVPLVGENRILVRAGLSRLPGSRWPGVRALLRETGLGGRIAGSDVGYRIGPRINASGRLGTAADSLELLLTDDPSRAGELARSLEMQNRERQTVERQVVSRADEWIAAHFDPRRDTTIVAGGQDWHQGVVGIVAARVMRKHYRPTIIVGFDESGSGKGSCRSIQGLSLVDTLAECGELLEKFGGHEMAAGLTIRESRFQEFRRAFESAVRPLITPELLIPRLHVDAEVDLTDIDEEFLMAVESLEPFGAGNAQPVFMARAVTPCVPPRLLKEKHRKLQFHSRSGTLHAIHFNAVESPLPRPPWDLAFRIERNTYGGKSEPNLIVADLRPTA